MKGIYVLRILIAFPLAGLGLPDLFFKLHDAQYVIPAAHYYIFGILLIIYLLLLIDPLHRYRKSV